MDLITQASSWPLKLCRHFFAYLVLIVFSVTAIADDVNDFLNAVNSGDLQKVEAILLKTKPRKVWLGLRSHPLVDTKTAEGKTPLMLAAERDFSSIVSLLLKYGADPLVEYNGYTAYGLARLNESSQSLKLLEPGDPKSHGELLKLLSNASQKNDVKRGAALLFSGANPSQGMAPEFVEKAKQESEKLRERLPNDLMQFNFPIDKLKQLANATMMK